MPTWDISVQPHIYTHIGRLCLGRVRLPIGGKHNMDAPNATPSAPATAVAVDDDGPETATAPETR
jgi:hypothetical protein